MRNSVEVSTLLASAEAEGLVPEVTDDQELDGARFVLAQLALQTLFTRNELLDDCHFHLYLYDSISKRLTPVLEPDDGGTEPVESWLPGRGVVGEAWNEEALVVASGKECSDSTHGLTVAQQTRYRPLRAVSALPVWTASTHVIGVLGASSTKKGSALKTTDGREEMLLVSQLVSRILVNVLGWFADQ